MRRSTIYEKVNILSGGFKSITLKSGREITLTDARSHAEGALTALYTWTSRMGKLARDYVDGWGSLGEDDLAKYDFDWEQIERHIDRVEEFVGVWRAEIRKHHERRSKEIRIRALRHVEGRSPEEAASYLAKADQLERELKQAR